MKGEGPGSPTGAARGCVLTEWILGSQCRALSASKSPETVALEIIGPKHFMEKARREAERSTIRLSDNDPAYLPEGSTGAFGNARRSKVRIGPATWTQALQQVLGLPPNWRAHSYCILLDAGEDSEHPH